MTNTFQIRSFWCRALLGCWLLLIPCLPGAEPKSAGEYQVKAVFLYNFTRFIDWPDSAFSSTNAPLVIGLLGEDPFGPVLDEAVRGEVVHNRPLTIVRLKRGDPIPLCHILFISPSERDQLEDVARNLKGKPILVVADTARAAERGAMINLTAQENVRMEINLAAAEQAGLRISSRLLSIARIVSPERSRKSP